MKKYPQPTKHIYIVNLIGDDYERLLFATQDKKVADEYCKKANKMIKKWRKYFDKIWDNNETYPFHNHSRFWQWYEVSKVVIVKTELR